MGRHVSLNRFASLVEFDPVKLSAAIQLGAAVGFRSQRLGGRAAGTLALDAGRVERFVDSRQLDTELIKNVVRQNAPVLLGFGEAACGMWNARTESDSAVMIMEPIAAGMAAKLCGPTWDHESLPFSWFSWTSYLPL
jgi:hypothetical protein